MVVVATNPLLMINLLVMTNPLLMINLLVMTNPPVDDQPPSYDEPYPEPLGNLLDNDSDPEGDSLAVSGSRWFQHRFCVPQRRWHFRLRPLRRV